MQSVLNSLLLKCHQQPFIGEMLIHNFLISKIIYFFFSPISQSDVPPRSLQSQTDKVRPEILFEKIPRLKC